jgi:2-haloacid dehalogenase
MTDATQKPIAGRSQTALRDFEVLSFDCYGTLIDWESGIHAALAPLLSRAGADPSAAGAASSRAGMGVSRAGLDLSRNAALEAFARLEARQQEKTPDMLYPDLLAEVHGQLAAGWDVARDPAEDSAFGRSIADWPPFPDTVAALQYLKQHFRLVILSNVDRASFTATIKHLKVTFDAIYTAQDIGSYKPDPRNFAYLIDRLRAQGTPKEKLLHVAQSLFHDHVPAQALGLATAWIDRHDAPGTAAITPAGARYDYAFKTLGAFAEAHRSGA